MSVWKKLQKAMERIVSMKDQYDHVINSSLHDYRFGRQPLADYVVDQALECMKKIVCQPQKSGRFQIRLQLNATKNGQAGYGDVFMPLMAARRAFMKQDSAPFDCHEYVKLMHPSVAARGQSFWRLWIVLSEMQERVSCKCKNNLKLKL